MHPLRASLCSVLVIMSVLVWSDPCCAQSCEGRGWQEKLSARSGLAMAYDSARGVTVLFGGGGPGTFNSNTWEWDGTEWRLRATTGPSPRSGHAMAYDSVRGVTVLFGGADSSGYVG